MGAVTAGRRFVVVGAGIIGTSTAYHLAAAGAEVVLVSEGGACSGASGRSLSWLNSSGEKHPDYHALRMAGLERYRKFAGAIALPYLLFEGGLSWNESLAEQVAEHEHEVNSGYSSRWVQPFELDRIAPGVDRAAVPEHGALFHAAEGWVDLPSMVAELLRRFVAAGGHMVLNSGPVEPTMTYGDVVGVVTAAGERYRADAVLLATGARVPEQLSRLGLELPEATRNALLVETKPFGTSLRCVLNTPRVSLRPAPTGGIVLDSWWSEEQLGTATDGSVEVPAETVPALLAEASQVLAGHPVLSAARIGVGPKPMPADGEPVVGFVPGLQGLAIAFTHSGATLGLIIGELLASELVSGKRDALLDRFSPDRMLSRGA